MPAPALRNRRAPEFWALSTSGVTRTPRFDHFSPELYSFDNTQVLQNPHTRQYEFARASVSCVEDGLKLGS